MKTSVPWQPQEYTPDPARITLRAAGVHFRAPVLVNLLSGESVRITNARDEAGATVFDGLPMFDFPLVILEQSDIVASPTHSSPAHPAIPAIEVTVTAAQGTWAAPRK